MDDASATFGSERAGSANRSVTAAALHFDALTLRDLDALEALLRNEAVYRHIGGVPTPERFRLATTRALAGPPADRPGERWLNFAVSDAKTDELLGRLEATVHGGLAEVAFLFGPQHWGRGVATRGLQWLHTQLPGLPLWATTVPANTRCQALLLRCGYRAVDPSSAPRLYSYDPGDLVFTRDAEG